MASILDFFRKEQPKSQSDNSLGLSFEPHGSSGTEIFSGYIQEEYLRELQGTEAADIFDKMRRSDTQVKMVLSAVKNPIKGANWFIESASDLGRDKYMSDFIHFNLMEDLGKPWRKTLHEVLSMIEFGFSILELTHKIVKDEKTFGTYVGLGNLAWRSPRTIERFNVDKTGKLVSISQQAYGDAGKQVDIPAEFIHLFSLDAEGDNYSGVSLLRSCYGAWLRKQAYLKWMAIGIEKTAVPTPVGEVPEGKENSPEFTRFKRILELYTSHQSQYITLPAGWKVNFNPTSFEPEKVVQAIDMEDKAIVKSFLANFLELGISTGGGSYSLSFDQSDFFLKGIEHVADIVCEVFNDQIIPSLIKLNFGPQKEYPKLAYSGISDRAGKELADTLVALGNGQFIKPDDKLETFIRQKYDLPEADTSTSRSAPAAPQAPLFSEAEKKSLKFAEVKKSKAHKLISESSKELTALMQEHLEEIGRDMIKQLVNRFRALPYSRSLEAIGKVESHGSLKYKQALKDFLTQLSGQAIDQAKVEVGVKLSEGSIQFAKRPFRFESLPKTVRDRLTTESALLVGSQIADIEKILFFTYAKSAPDSDSAKMIEGDLQDVLKKQITGPSVLSAGSNSSAKTVNSARQAYFFDDEVINQIESFTFVNPDPVAPICKELNGTTVGPDDPRLEQYATPLHHNCKSTWLPNLKGVKGSPEITKFPALSKQAQSSNTL